MLESLDGNAFSQKYMVLTGTKQLYQVLAHFLSFGFDVDLTAVSIFHLCHLEPGVTKGFS